MESPFEITREAFDRLMAAFDEIAVLDDYEDDGQPTEWEEWQDVHGGDDGFEQWEVNY